MISIDLVNLEIFLANLVMDGVKGDTFFVLYGPSWTSYVWRVTRMRTTVPVHSLSYSSQGGTNEPEMSTMFHCLSFAR